MPFPGRTIFPKFPTFTSPLCERVVRIDSCVEGVAESLKAVTPGEEKHGHRRTYNLDTLIEDLKKADLRGAESGRVILKPLSNAQFDAAMESGIVSREYLAAWEQLFRVWPEFSASIYAIVEIQPGLRGFTNHFADFKNRFARYPAVEREPQRRVGKMASRGYVVQNWNTLKGLHLMTP